MEEDQSTKRKTRRPRKYNSSEFDLGKKTYNKDRSDQQQCETDEIDLNDNGMEDEDNNNIPEQREEKLFEDKKFSSDHSNSPIFYKKFKPHNHSSSDGSTTISIEKNHIHSGGIDNSSGSDLESLKVSDEEGKNIDLSEEDVRHIESESELDEDYTDVPPVTFTFNLTTEEWLRIKPEPSLVGRHLSKNWSNIFSDKIEQVIPSCVLRFTYNRVAKQHTRKKNAVFFSGKAKCTFDNCLTFTISIQKEPLDTDQTVTVDVETEGNISHPRNERRKRHLSGARRDDYREQANKIGSCNLHYKKLGEMNQSAYAAGNRTQATSKPVLRNLVYESNLSQKLDTDDWRDLVITQEVIKDTDESRIIFGYIQLLSFSPFISVCFKEDQLRMFREKVKLGEGVLYLDATGSVVRRTNNKTKPVFYYAAVVKGTKPNDPPIPVFEMLSNDQSSTAIILGLSKFKQESIRLFHRWGPCQPMRVEVDFSWPLINAALLVFNQENVSSYLTKAWNFKTNKVSKENITVVHICAAHLLKRFRDKVSKLTVDKGLGEYFTYVFALFQNATSIETASTVYEELCLVAQSRYRNTEVVQALDNLTRKIRMLPLPDELDALETDLKSDEEECEITAQRTIKASSPFHRHFGNIRIKTKVTNTDTTEPNYHYCPQVLDLLDSYLYLFPLWSGILLVTESTSRLVTRDTNCFVENWFNIVKNTILKKKLHRPAGVLIRQMHSDIRGRIRECLTSINDEKVAKKKKTKSNIGESKLEQDDIDKMEEQWQKRKTKDTKSKYFSPPSKMPGPKVKKTNIGKPPTKQFEKTISSGSDDLPDIFPGKGFDENSEKKKNREKRCNKNDDDDSKYADPDTSLAQHGLENKNNNCWLNSMLQAMKHVNVYHLPTSSGTYTCIKFLTNRYN